MVYFQTIVGAAQICRIILKLSFPYREAMGRQRNDTPDRLTIDDNDDITTQEKEKKRNNRLPFLDPPTNTVVCGRCSGEQYPSQRQEHAPFINHGRGSTVTVGPANIGGDARGEEAAAAA